MKKYLKEYILKTERKLKGKITPKDIEELKIKIQFFQHERLIHLLVTLAYAFFAIIFFIVSMLSLWFLIPFFCLISFLLCYIIHYFFLENSVQYLYKLYDKMVKM